MSVMSAESSDDRPSVRFNYSSLFEEVRELLIYFLRNGRLSSEKLTLLARLMRSTTFRQLARSSHSPLETAFYLLRVGTVALQLAADGRVEAALTTLLAGFDEVEAYDGDEDPFDGLLFALGARLAQRLGNERLQERLTERVSWFAAQDESKAERLRWILEELGRGGGDDATG